MFPLAACESAEARPINAVRPPPPVPGGRAESTAHAPEYGPEPRLERGIPGLQHDHLAFNRAGLDTAQNSSVLPSTIPRLSKDPFLMTCQRRLIEGAEQRVYGYEKDIALLRNDDGSDGAHTLGELEPLCLDLYRDRIAYDTLLFVAWVRCR